jgi:hypothetical protein
MAQLPARVVRSVRNGKNWIELQFERPVLRVAMTAAVARALATKLHIESDKIAPRICDN